MNVIFLDFDGVINTLNSIFPPKEDDNALEKRVKILGDICKKYDCKIVIESSHKKYIDEETLETDLKWIQNYFNLFKKYGIECVGRTPCIKTEIKPGKYVDIWKENEILEYLKMHPEVERFCIIDDDDLVSEPNKEKGNYSNSDLNMFRDYLITPHFYSDKDPNLAGLQEEHIEEVGKILEKENIFKNKTY